MIDAPGPAELPGREARLGRAATQNVAHNRVFALANASALAELEAVACQPCLSCLSHGLPPKTDPFNGSRFFWGAANRADSISKIFLQWIMSLRHITDSP